MGTTKRVEDAIGQYAVFSKNSFLPPDARGMRVVNCAHGASYKVAPKVFSELGAEVFPIGVSLNGMNINEQCGALSSLARNVLHVRADLGFAFDETRLFDCR